MSKKIYIGEDNLISIKNAMAGKNISHSTFMSEDKPPYEKDEYEIGGEGGNNDFFHVNESYGFSRNVDLSEVGRVNYTWDFDEDYYLEWLEDNEYADNEDIKLQYIKEGNVEFELDFCDNQTYHSMGSDNVYYDDLEDLFGERMAETILKNCIEDGSGYFDTEELYYDDNFDINSPSELDDMAMKVLRHGEYYKDCRGFILSNGVVVYTDMEHNEVTRIPGINNKFQFIELGNIRVLDHSIDIGKEPTRQQYDVLKQVLRTYDGEELYLDIFHNNSEIGVHYPSCNPNYVLGEITRFYSEGIKPQGGTFYEEKQVVKENTFEKWFEGSVLVDEDGKPIKMYHGTSKKFDSFSKDFINSSGAGAYEGYGFNFTPHWSTAAHYSTDGNIIEAYLSVKHPLKSTENTLSLNTVMKVIAEIDKGVPVTDRIVVAFESPRYNENWDEVYYKRALRKAAQSIIEYNGEDYGNAGIYAGVCESGQGNPKKTIEAFEKLGYDSAIFYDENGKIRTVIVFEPNQIKLVNNKTFSIDSDIMSENIESKRYKKIIMPENKLITIKEHHLDQRLPFDDNEFSRKRYIEQYVDWLEEFGRYGELPNGSLDFWEEIAKAVKVIREKSLHGRFDNSFPLNKTDEEIVEELRGEKIGPYLKLDGEKVYVERAIKIDKSPKDYYNGKEPKDDELYTKLINTYNDNVGGCWCYKKGGAQAYCSSSGNGYKILLCGFIRTDDIDFIKTVQLNYHYPSEHEIRVKPFAKIELEGIGYNGSSSIPFSRHLIVSATYSGNNSKSNVLGYTKVDDGFGGVKYIDRRNNRETTKDELNKERMNRLANGEITLDLFDYAEEVSNGFVKVELNDKWNLINQEGRLISDQWYDFINNLSNGLVKVGLNGKQNFINKEGELLSDKWFDNAFYFANGFAKVELNGKKNLINQEGRLTSDQWLDWIGDFANSGFAKVLLNGKQNLINQEGRLVSDKWFDYAYDFANGFARVELSGKRNFINKDGRIISDKWFDDVNNFVNGFAKVELSRKYNLINQEGELLSSQWFDYVYNFANGFAKVSLNGEFNLINQEGRLISDQWFGQIDDFENGFANVELNGKWNFINKEGELLSDQWFDGIYDFDYGFATVILNGKYNLINQEGRLISDQWFDDAHNFTYNGFANVKLNGKYYKLDTNGNLTPLSESKKHKKIIMPENKLIAIKENIESEVEANEVSLDSFKKQKELAPKIWDGYKLNSRVRLKLLDIADDFWETTDIGWVRPKGIVLMGSICNYNWSKSSDIDLHLQVDFSEVDEKKDFVQEYFNGKKNEWNEEHSNLKIFGFPVEVYVEDIDADTNSGGIYDLEENDWIKKPSKDGIKQIGLNKYSIKDKSAKIMTDIDDLYDLFKKTDDDAKLRKIGEKARHILDYVKAMRKDGLSRGGESDKDNIVYKVLRRTGYMDTLWNLSSQLYDKLNSIDEVTEGQAGLILEYLEDKHNLPLYQYFKWAKSATDKDKAIDLLRQCGDVAIKYLETRNANQCDELRDLRIRLKRDGEDAQYENDFIEEFGNGIANNGLMRDFEFFMRYRGDFYELPSWMTMDFNRIVKNEWCIHFCYDADSIAREGFKWGTDDMGKLALTGAGMEKPSEGYNFAFPVGEYHIDNNSYGSFNPSTRQRGSQEAVIFQTSGVEVYHEGDEQNQVVFWGPNAKNFIPIKYDREQGGWCIYGNKGQVLYTGKPSKILEWVLTNLPQYRKQIMVGKNGVNLKENTDLFTLAKEKFGTTYDIRECGYILPDGSMLDFSGKHMITGNTDTSHLRGRRSIDHRDIIDLKWDADMSTETGINTNMEEFIRSGAIRIHCSNTWSSINLFNKPTKEQINVLLRLIQYSKGNVTVEIGDGNESYSYAEYDEAKPRKVISDIVKYFDEGINLIGNVTENKVIKEYFNKYCCLNEEVVADGNASHNPFKQRWKHERETLINYLVNYGELMTSKENGKQYKVLFDGMLSNRIGFNYCLCIQWNPLTMEPGNVIYVRAYDKFTKKIFRPQFDYRGRDNLEGTLDDVV